MASDPILHFHPLPQHQRNPNPILNIQETIPSTIFEEIQIETSNDNIPDSSKRRSKYKSCERCRKYKRKCDGKRPSCTNCEKASTNRAIGAEFIPCNYAYRPKKKESFAKIYSLNYIHQSISNDVGLFCLNRGNLVQQSYDDGSNINPENITTTISDIPNRNLLGEINNFQQPDNSSQFENSFSSSQLNSILSDLHQSTLFDLSYGLKMYDDDMTSIILSSNTVENFKSISNIPSSSELDSVIFPDIPILAEPVENAPIPSFNISIDDSWGAKENNQIQDFNDSASNDAYDFNTLEEIHEQILVASSHNNTDSSYCNYRLILFILFFQIYFSRPFLY